MSERAIQTQRVQNLPQVDHLFERDVGGVVAAPSASISRAVAAVANEERVSIRIAVCVQESSDAPENFTGLHQGCQG